MKHCLIVDDSSVIRKVTRRIIEDLNLVIMEAENGQEALERCQREMPDVILLDSQMPVMGAMEFLSALDLPAESGKRPIIFYCTSENDRMEISRAFKLGANDYIMKPFDRHVIESKFAEAGLA